MQIHAAIILFHNRMVNRALEGKGTPALSGRAAFDWARSRVVHHYQRILLDDFLPRVVDTDSPAVKHIFNALQTANCLAFGYRNWPKVLICHRVRRSCLPVRPFDDPPRLPTRFGARQRHHSFPIFKGDYGGLRGFRRLDKARGIEWRLFFHPDLEAGAPLAGAALVENNDDASKRHRTQLAYKIDTMLVAPLGALPPAVAADPANLAARTLHAVSCFTCPAAKN